MKLQVNDYDIIPAKVDGNKNMLGPEINFLKSSERLLLKNISCLLTMDTPSGLGIQENVDLLIEGHHIRAIERSIQDDARSIDCSGLCVAPGLIDVHTHSLFAGSRANETIAKARGDSYQQIAAQGGGIQASCISTRKASDEQLLGLLTDRLSRFLRQGVCCVEVKTGYGLNPKEELRLLKLIDRFIKSETNRPFIVPSYLAPHAASPEYDSLDAYIDALCEQLGELDTFEDWAWSVQDFLCTQARVDIFIEEGYFTRFQAKKWLEKALSLGWDASIHADEFSDAGAASLAIELSRGNRFKGKIRSLDHGQFISPQSLEEMARLDICLVILPLTSFFSNIAYRQADEAIKAGVRVVVASDFNPGSAPIANLWLACYLALSRCSMSRDQVIRAVTCEAAYCLGLENKLGSIRGGALANLIAWPGEGPDSFFDSPTGEHISKVWLASL